MILFLALKCMKFEFNAHIKSYLSTDASLYCIYIDCFEKCINLKSCLNDAEQENIFFNVFKFILRGCNIVLIPATFKYTLFRNIIPRIYSRILIKSQLETCLQIKPDDNTFT